MSQKTDAPILSLAGSPGGDPTPRGTKQRAKRTRAENAPAPTREQEVASTEEAKVAPKPAPKKRGPKPKNAAQPAADSLATLTPTAAAPIEADADDTPIVVDVMAQRERQLSALPVDRKLVVDAVASIIREAAGTDEMMPRKELRHRVEEKVGGVPLNAHKNILYTLAVEASTANDKKTAAAEKRATKKADKVGQKASDKPQKPPTPQVQPILSPDPQVPAQAPPASEKQKSRRAKKKEIAAAIPAANVSAPAAAVPVMPAAVPVMPAAVAAASESDATGPKKRGRKPKRDAEGTAVASAAATMPHATVAVPVTTLEAIMQRLASQDTRIDTLGAEVKKLRQEKIATTLDAVVRNL